MVKLYPAHGLSTFGVYHYYQQRHINWTPYFPGDENLRAGYYYNVFPRKEMSNVPECWKKVIAENREEQSKDTKYPLIHYDGSLT